MSAFLHRNDNGPGEPIDQPSKWTIDIPHDRDALDLAETVARAVRTISDSGGGPTDLWIHGVDAPSHAVAIGCGFEPYRDLWQLRCPLPAEPSPLPTRSFATADADAIIEVNNRAFSWHPEQAGMTRSSLQATMSESWFNPDGFRVYETDDDGTPRVDGFCWTKVHADEDPVLGEIFVIALDPRVHGQGLGSPMTRAGLDWLAAQGIRHGMLYVESDNVAANRTYQRIGFGHHRTDRAYHRTIEASTP